MRFPLLLVVSLYFQVPGSVKAQVIHRMSFDGMEQRLHGISDSLVVLNFWATWCKPCVEELPYFDSAPDRHPDRPLKIILVNLDFNSRVSSLAEPFVVKRKVRSEVWHLDDTDPNTWINRLDPAWSGAIPASAFYYNGKKLDFREGQLTRVELDQIIQRLSEHR